MWPRSVSGSLKTKTDNQNLAFAGRLLRSFVSRNESVDEYLKL